MLGDYIRALGLSFRLVADLIDVGTTLYCGTSGGSGNDYDLSPNIKINRYSNGARFLFIADKTNTGATTASLLGQSTKSVVRDDAGTALIGGEIVAGQTVELMYNSNLDALMLVRAGFSGGATLGGEHITGITVSAGAEQATAHSLGVTPSMVIITARKGGVVEDGTTPNTSTNFYLENKGFVNATVDVLVMP